MIGNGQVDVDRVRESSGESKGESKGEWKGESKGDVGAMGGNQSRTLSQTMIDSANGKGWAFDIITHTSKVFVARRSSLVL